MSKRIPRIHFLVLSLLLGLPATWSAAQDTAAPPPASEATPPADAALPAPPATVSVVIHSAMGDVTVALEVERAPITAKNFLRYVDNKRFDNITFYRAMKVSEDGKYGIVQGGQRNPQLQFKPIAHESPAATGLSHVDGAISMGRNAPGTAAADFFFIIGDLRSMDGSPDGKDPGYGRVWPRHRWHGRDTRHRAAAAGRRKRTIR